MAEFHPFMGKRQKGTEPEQVLILRELTDVYTPAGLIGSSEDVLRRAKETKNWTVRSAIEFFRDVVGVMRDEQMPTLLQNIVSNMPLDVVYDFLAVLADNEFREMVSLMAHSKDNEAEGTTEFTTIFGDAPAGLEKLAQLVKVWKTKNGVEDERLVEMLTDMCMGWFPEITDDPNLSIFINLLLRNQFTVNTIVDVLGKLYEEDSSNGVQWENEDPTFSFLKDMCGGWTTDQKKALMIALPLWGWKTAAWDRAYESLYAKKFDAKADPALRDVSAQLRAQPTAKGKKGKKNKKAAAAATGTAGKPRAGGGPSFPAFGGGRTAAGVPLDDEDDDEDEDEDEFGEMDPDMMEEMMAQLGAAGMPMNQAGMAEVMRMMAGMRMPGGGGMPFGVPPGMFGGEGDDDEDVEIDSDEDDMPPLQSAPPKRGGSSKPAGKPAPRGGGGSAARGGPRGRAKRR